MQAAERSKRRLRAVLFSFAIHAAFFSAVFLLGKRAVIRILQPVHVESIAQIAHAGGSHAIRITLPPSKVAAHTLRPEANVDAAKKTNIPMNVPAIRKSGGGSPRSPHHGDGSSTAMTGNGSDAQDIHPAFPVFSPHPPVRDRALLPSSEQKIVIDVSVDALGQVIHETLVKGLGTQLDKIVLDTVKTWRFQPATVNGKPIATEAELIFPFNQDYPITIS
jgi:protein TonB